MMEPFQISVDKAQFLEVGRVLKSAYRGSAANVILTLGGGKLQIAFYNGGCELSCEHEFDAVVEMTAKKFRDVIAEHRKDKTTEGKITLTFRPGLGEFATPLAGAKAKFHKIQKSERP